MNRYSIVFKAAILMAGVFSVPAAFAQDHLQNMAGAEAQVGPIAIF